jgi:hypothetical protein
MGLTNLLKYKNYLNNHRKVMIKLKTSYSSNRWFDNQKQLAEFLGIKNSSKKSIESRCKKFNFEVEFNY